MSGRRAIVGLCMLCALMISAVAAQSASAAFTGTTSVTCVKVAEGAETTKGFKDEHCKEKVGNGTTGGKQVKFEHKVWTKLTTEIDGSDETTNGLHSGAVLTSTQSGIAEELTATSVEKKPETAAMAENVLVGEEHITRGTGQLTYTGVEVKKPEGKGCKVFEVGGVNEGMVSTKPLKATSAGVGMGIKFEPAEGTVFSEFEIKSCTVAALNGVYKAEGSLVATPEGATLVTTTAGVIAQGTLTLRGQKAGLGGSLTLKGREELVPPSGEYTPLSVTTTGEE